MRSEILAGATGLEPAASCVTGRRSNQLNYAPATDFLMTSSTTASFYDLYVLLGFRDSAPLLGFSTTYKPVGNA